EYLSLSNEEVPVEDQPYVVVDLPTTLSLGYIADSDPEDESEDGPMDYLVNVGDDDDDDSLGDDAGEEEEEEASKKDEDEEHLSPTDSTAVASPVVDP
ncbi:hypothetical protein Tco_0562997, partial [Tanacetum coccineum]